MAEISRELRISRAQVARIIERAGGVDHAEVLAARFEWHLRRACECSEEILARYRSGADPQLIARELALDGRAVKLVIRERRGDADRRARAWALASAPAVRFSDEQLLNGLWRVAERLGRAPSGPEYERVAHALGLASRWTLTQRFDGWRNALRAAGLNAPEPVRRRARQWDEAACWRALESVADQLGDPPRYRRYLELAAGAGDLPSGSVVRQRLGLWPHIAAAIGRGGQVRETGREQAVPVGKEQLTVRDREIVELRSAGLTLREIATRFGLTYQRVAQILAGSPEASEIDFARARGERDQRRRQERSAQILELWRQGLSLGEIRERAGVSAKAIRSTITELATDADRDARTRAISAHRPAVLALYTDEQLIAGLRAVAERAERPPTGGDYERLRRRLRLASTATVYMRFGSWSEALRAACLEPPAPSGRVYTARWDAGACWRALESVADQLGDPPRYRRYAELAAQREDLPSAATVRLRLGLWSDVADALTARRGRSRMDGAEASA